VLHIKDKVDPLCATTSPSKVVLSGSPMKQPFLKFQRFAGSHLGAFRHNCGSITRKSYQIEFLNSPSGQRGRNRWQIIYGNKPPVFAFQVKSVCGYWRGLTPRRTSINSSGCCTHFNWSHIKTDLKLSVITGWRIMIV